MLGLVWQLGSASPYDIRRVMLDSPSTQWSASTGAIYPLVRRLERLGHIRSRGERTGRRVRRTYTITVKGLSALREWVGPPLAREAVSVVYDPLRTRARFLGALRPAQRREWVDAALAALDEVQRLVARWDELYGAAGAGEGDQRLAVPLLTRHAEHDLAGRRRWLAEVREVVAGAPAGKGKAGQG